MPAQLWPLNDSFELHLPIGANVSVSLTLRDPVSGASASPSGTQYAAVVYRRLARTQAASGVATVTQPSGAITITFLSTETANLNERRHYYWTLTNLTTNTLALDGVCHAHLPGNWPSTPYRGRYVTSRLATLT
jgi:hypothetical protein